MNISGEHYDNERLAIRYDITFDNQPGVLFRFNLILDQLKLYFAIYCYENYKSLPMINGPLRPSTNYESSLNILNLRFDFEDGGLYWYTQTMEFTGEALNSLLATLLSDIKEFKESNKPKKIPIGEDYEIKYLKDQKYLVLKRGETEIIIPLSFNELKGLGKTKNYPFYFADHILRIENTIRIRRHNKQRLVIYKFSPSLLDKFYSISAEL